MATMDARTRDVLIRTMLGEAASESDLGLAAVAHVILNRSRDPRWPAAPADVALQPQQFSAWNKGAGGNDLVRKYGPQTKPYQRAASVLDAVLAGQMPDQTGGAVYYYSPAGMQALVKSGAQSNTLPRWLEAANKERGGAPVTIGGHIFTGRSAGAQEMAAGGAAPATEQPAILAGLQELLAAQPAPTGLLASMMPQPAPPPAIMPRQMMPLAPAQRDNAALYAKFFNSLG